jgi:hypothetical protein
MKNVINNQAHFGVITPSICTLNMATTIEKQKVRREIR